MAKPSALGRLASNRLVNVKEKRVTFYTKRGKFTGSWTTRGRWDAFLKSSRKPIQFGRYVTPEAHARKALFKDVQKYLVKVGEKRVTFYTIRKRAKKKDFKLGKLVGTGKWVSLERWEKFKEDLAFPLELHKKFKKQEIPRGVQKAALKPSALKVRYKVRSTKEKHTSVFLAYTKEQKTDFMASMKGKRLPMQFDGRGKPRDTIDLSEEASEEEISGGVLEQESP